MSAEALGYLGAGVLLGVFAALGVVAVYRRGRRRAPRHRRTPEDWDEADDGE